MNYDLHYTSPSYINMLPSYFADAFSPDISSMLKDGVDKTPLHVAALIGNLEQVKYLVEHGADVDEKSGDGKSPLHYAIIGGSIEIVKYLVEHGADVNAEVQRY